MASIAAGPPFDRTRSERTRPRVDRGPSKFEWLLSVSLISGSLRLVDGGVLLIAAAVADAVYLDQFELSESQRQLYDGLPIFAALLQVNIFHFSDLYRFRRLARFGYQAGHVLLAVAILFLGLLAVLYMAKLSAAYSRGWMTLWFLGTVGGLLAVRVALCPIAQRLVRRGYLARRIAVVGSSGTAERLVTYLSEFNKARLRFVGIFDDRENVRDDNATHPDGTIDELCERARLQDIDAIIIAMPEVSEERLASILSKLRSLPVDIRLCKDALEYCLPQSSYEFCGIVPLLRLYNKPVSGWGLVAKSIEDKILASLLLLWLGPLMIVIAMLIKIDSPGPVFFKQKRYGFNNRLITVWKFRTMYHDQRDPNCERQTTRDDPRVTRIGRFLRELSLDELPQVINILKGDMSIVGPRPHAVSSKAAGRLFENVVDEYAARHRVKPGITGWAQVNGWRGETNTVEKIQERIKHDLYYIDNWSIWLDLKILLKTVYVVIKRENAF